VSPIRVAGWSGPRRFSRHVHPGLDLDPVDNRRRSRLRVGPSTRRSVQLAHCGPLRGAHMQSSPSSHWRRGRAPESTTRNKQPVIHPPSATWQQLTGDHIRPPVDAATAPADTHQTDFACVVTTPAHGYHTASGSTALYRRTPVPASASEPPQRSGVAQQMIQHIDHPPSRQVAAGC